MGKGKKSRHSSKRKHRTEDVEEGGNGFHSMIGRWPAPLAGAMLGTEFIFGLVYLIIGAININKCNIQPMIPIWLVMMGVVLLVSVLHEGIQYILAQKRKPTGKFPIIISVLLALVTFGIFVAGNAFVYIAWAQQPDYGHYWFSNGCNMGAYFLAFISVIVMDVLAGLLVIGAIISVIFLSCNK